MKEKFKVICKLVGLFLFLIVIFFLSITLTYLLPKETLRENAQSAVETFKKEGVFFRPFFDTNENLSYSYTLDNFTDSLILDIAVVENRENKNIFEKTVLNEKYRTGKPVEDYEKIFLENKTANGSYTRYWFGQLVVLKPLLMFVSYQTIRYINIIFVFCFLFLTVLLLDRKIGFKYAISFFISMLLCGITIIPLSMQFSPVFIISFIACIYILLYYEKNYFNKSLKYIFLIIGCVTSFFDLLTAPLLTFGIPVLVLMNLRNKKTNYAFEENLLLVIKLGMIWGISYGMTYFAKWIIASIILKSNQIIPALKQFVSRTDANNEYTIMQTIEKNFELYFNKFVLIGMIVFFIVELIIIIKNKRYKNINKNIIIFLCIAILPYCWYAVLKNHSWIHNWMTYRLQAITMISITSMLFYVLDNKVIEKEE